jgi:hypothetical protein
MLLGIKCKFLKYLKNITRADFVSATFSLNKYKYQVFRDYVFFFVPTFAPTNLYYCLIFWHARTPERVAVNERDWCVGINTAS